MHRSRTKQIAAVVCVIGLAACVAGQGAVIYVDDDAVGANNGSSWADAFTCLQDALVFAQAGDEVHVAQGIYRPDEGAGIATGDVGAAFELRDGVAIMGGFAGSGAADPDARHIVRYETILSGDLAGDDVPVGDPCDLLIEPSRAENSTAIVQVGPCSRAAVLDGLTIASAYAPDRRLYGGAGLVLLGEDGFCGPSIRNCTFVGHAGGAIYAVDACPELIDCVFEQNAARYGGAIEFATSTGVDQDLVIERCSFLDNHASDFGGALYAYVLPGRGGSSAYPRPIVIDGCVLEGNTAERGGAMYVYLYQPAVVVGSRFTRNLASERGGAIYSGGPTTPTDCCFEGNQAGVGGAIYGYISRLKDCRFTGNVAYDWAGAVGVAGTLICENCLFAGNVGWETIGAVYTQGDLLFANCTLAANRAADEVLFLAGGSRGGLRRSVLTQCILYGLTEPLNPSDYWLSNTTMTFSGVQGGFLGEGNFDVDPLFAAPGHWVDAGTPGDITDDVWAGGDYHLKSQAGRWDLGSESWVIDDVTSPCIDAGDPNGPIGLEPFPNGGVPNLGAYGGTAQASKSYFGQLPCDRHMAGDINGDCKVDLTDLLIVVSQWMPEIVPPIAIVEPQDGDVFEDPAEPIFVCIEVNDPDFQVTGMQVEITQGSGDVHYHGALPSAEGLDGWSIQPVFLDPGVYTIVAEARDDLLRVESSDPVVITVGP